MPRLYSLIFERQFKLEDLAKAMRFVLAKLRQFRPNSPGWREQPDFAEFDKTDFAETRVVDPNGLNDALLRSSQVEVSEDSLDTIPAELQEEFVKSVAKAMQEHVVKEPGPQS